jgi:hypothetical protein
MVIPLRFAADFNSIPPAARTLAPTLLLTVAWIENLEPRRLRVVSLPSSRPAPRRATAAHRNRGAIMSYRETEFCRRQAERLRLLAEECVNPEICKQITEMAAEWADEG